jgi:hypothetical protein
MERNLDVMNLFGKNAEKNQFLFVCLLMKGMKLLKEVSFEFVALES